MYIIILDDITEFTRNEDIASEGKMDKEKIRSFYEMNMYGVWKNGEKVTFECMGPDPKSEKDRKNPFEVIEVLGTEFDDIYKTSIQPH